MRFLRLSVAAGLCAASLSACSTTTGTPAEQEVGSVTMRTGDAANYEYIYQPTSGSPDRVLRLLPNAGWYYYPDTLAGVPAEFSVYLQSSQGYLLRGTVDGGEVIIVDNGAQLTRTGTTILPAALNTGGVTYGGTYGGIVVDGTGDMSPSTISGIVEIEVDFHDYAVSGSISNRVLDETIAANDITLDLTDLIDGAFEGTTTGGDLNTGGLVASAGTYTGLIVGPNGEHIIGAVTITHTGVDGVVEQGGMILSQ
ncbi:hypothetical protein DS901_16020 [Loktanella sp. D2R18]|uniref:hypothetical protein n=1 Tax=Rhodobacterales TaxID=204455 RepID=UPI000DE89DBB|nr:MULTISPECIES: hypothetical protein [Rhodobacterales]MDO6591031.1 hypothetical protein [Yoonia sp. 1_MG-2023]RBW42215.1 hypothetical protein DS901_16020 [Loktanella sp. D2R18]